MSTPARGSFVRANGDKERGSLIHYTLAMASHAEREEIHRLRFEVYACELGQHQRNREGMLRDALDDWNHYLVVKRKHKIAGFISITPPTAPSFSIDKYFPRQDLPFVVDELSYEVRLLTVVRRHRASDVAALLMYAALRWVEAHGGEQIVGIGRHEIMDLYLRCGLHSTGRNAKSGRVRYELMHGTTSELRQRADSRNKLLSRLEKKTEWKLPFTFRQPAGCFHGGAFFEAVGDRFDKLDRRHEIINADVLDAWFPPAPAVTENLQRHLPWLLQTSPPTDCRGLTETIAEVRKVKPANLLPGAGSSDLIFRAFRYWLTPSSRVLILDPTYGEYAHVLERVIGCTVDRFSLEAEEGFAPDPERLGSALEDGYDLVVLVNPNSPTGCHLPREQLAAALKRAPMHTRVWVDETYVEYAGADQTVESIAAASENVIVCKSMSKVYALSGARVAYLCAGEHQLESLRALTPPWVVGLPSQVAAVQALRAADYYRERYHETAVLRESLARGLETLGWRVWPGIANFLLCSLPPAGPSAATVVSLCQAKGLFLRDAQLMGERLGDRCIRVAVKSPNANRRIVEILTEVLGVECQRKRFVEPVRHSVRQPAIVGPAVCQMT